jgi:hypothetical protein
VAPIFYKLRQNTALSRQGWSTSLFYLYDKIGNGFAVGYERLVRRSGGDVDDVAGLQFLTRAAFDGLTADFTRACCLCFNKAAASDHGCMAINDEKDVSEVLMQFAASAVLPIGEHCVMVRILLDRLAG